MRPRMIKRLDNPRGNSGYEKSAKDHNRIEIEFAIKGGVAEIAALESFVSTPSQMRCDTGMGSGRFTRTHVVKIWDAHSLQLSGMNSSCVVPTRSGSRPSMDLLLSEQDVHRVAGFNRVDISPTNGVLVERIGYDDSFIIESDFGSDEEQVCDARNERADDQCGNSSLQIALVEISARHSSTENEDSKSVEETASRSERLRIVHGESFSWKIERSAA